LFGVDALVLLVAGRVVDRVATGGGARRPVTPVTAIATIAATAARPPFGDGALGVGQQRQLPRRLDGNGHLALVLGAVAGDPAGPDLAPVAGEAAQGVGVLVVDPLGVPGAEDADLLLAPGRPGVLDRT